MGWNYISIPKLQRLHRWSLWMDMQFHPTFYDGCDYLSMLAFKLFHVSKRAPGREELTQWGMNKIKLPPFWKEHFQLFHAIFFKQKFCTLIQSLFQMVQLKNKSPMVQEMAWCHQAYASVNWVITGSSNGLRLCGRQAITRTNAELLLITPMGRNLNCMKFESK